MSQHNLLTTNRVDFLSDDGSTVLTSLYISGGALTIDGVPIAAGSGDVVGPGSSTNGNLVLFNGVTGKLIKDGGVPNTVIIGQLLTGYSSGAGTVAATDSILQAVNKLNGNAAAIKVTADAAAPALLSINPQTSSYTLVLGDAGKLVTMSNGSANNLTIPLNASVAFAVGTQIAVQQLGAGQTTVVATGGVTTQAQPGLKISAQYGLVTLIKVATNTWIVAGALSA